MINKVSKIQASLRITHSAQLLEI